MNNKTILELRKDLDNKTTTSEELFSSSVSLAHKYSKEFNPFVTIMDKLEEKLSSSLISGIPYTLKDNFSTKGILTTSSSNILKDYIPCYDSTVYKKLHDSGAVLVGKTVLDELAMGGNGLSGHTGIVHNAYDSSRISGGSSSGSVVSVALGIVPFSIGSDTGDSVRKPASLNGVVGFKPTYGRISRYGLFPFASSLDHVGVITSCVEDAAIVTDILKGRDEKDMTSLEDDNIIYSQNLHKNIKDKKLFYIKEIVSRDKYKNDTSEVNEILDNFFSLVDTLRKDGIEVEEVSVDPLLLDALYPVYYSISCAEATSNNANLTGYIYGNTKQGNTSEEIMINTRTSGFSEMIKRRFIMGSYILQRENQEKLFKNAGRIRRLIVDKMNELFLTYDALILPSSGSIAPLINEETKEDKLSDKYLMLENHLVIANFGGYPSISIPLCFVNNMPVGLSITSAAKEDLKLLNIASIIEEKTSLKGIISKGEKHV
ncbi:MAG: amidase family protein [Bacilli bacterium]